MGPISTVISNEGYTYNTLKNHSQNSAEVVKTNGTALTYFKNMMSSFIPTTPTGKIIALLALNIVLTGASETSLQSCAENCHMVYAYCFSENCELFGSSCVVMTACPTELLTCLNNCLNPII